jgi:hypothetical protein
MISIAPWKLTRSRPIGHVACSAFAAIHCGLGRALALVHRLSVIAVVLLFGFYAVDLWTFAIGGRVSPNGCRRSRSPVLRATATSRSPEPKTAIAPRWLRCAMRPKQPSCQNGPDL